MIAMDPMQPDREIQRLSAARNGRLRTADLYAAGLSRQAIRTRVKRGTLTRVRKGVYAVGDPDAYEFGPEAAALAAAGPRATLSHESAAYVQRPRKNRPRLIHITVLGRWIKPWPGVKIHNVRVLHRRDLRTVHGLTTTSPAKTILDCAATATQDELESLVDEARARKLVTPREIAATAVRYPRRRGATRLRGILDDETSGGTRSKMERKLRKLIEDANLPAPETNQPILAYTADFLWRHEKVIVEFDGRQTHDTPESFESDRDRDRALAARGYTVLRVTWRQLNNRPHKVVAEIAAALAIATIRAA
jgi:very-short-patch-repair endonuclease